MTRAEREFLAYREWLRIMERDLHLKIEIRAQVAFGVAFAKYGNLDEVGLDKDELRALRERRVFEAVAERHGVTIEQIKGGGKTPTLVAARDEAKAELTALGWKQVEVARALECDRKDVSDGVRRHQARTASTAMKKESHGA